MSLEFRGRQDGMYVFCMQEGHDLGKGQEQKSTD